MKKSIKKSILALLIALSSGVIMLFFGSAVNGWNETLVKKEWILKEFLTSRQISDQYVNKIEYAVLDGKIETINGKLDLLLAHKGLVYEEKENCPFPPCLCPKPPCSKKNKKESELVQNDSDLEGY